MVCLTALLIPIIAAIGVAAQLSANATYARAKNRDYWVAALDLFTQTKQIGALSCLEYNLNMGPYTKIVPLLNNITSTFSGSSGTIADFRPQLDPDIPDDVATGQEVIYYLVAGTIEISGAFDRMTQTGTANLCTVPALGTAIKTALESLLVAARPFYLALATFCPPQAVTISGQLLGFTSKLQAAISAYSSPVPI